jgi:hypothetical protein
VIVEILSDIASLSDFHGNQIKKAQGIYPAPSQTRISDYFAGAILSSILLIPSSSVIGLRKFSTRS